MFIYLLKIDHFFFSLFWFFFFFNFWFRQWRCCYAVIDYFKVNCKVKRFFFFFDYFLKYFFLLKLKLKKFFFSLFFFKFFFFFNFLLEKIFLSFKHLNIFLNFNFKNFFFNFLNFVFLCLTKHESEFFLNGVRMDLNEISFKNHKNYFLLLRAIFFCFHKYINIYYGIFGIYFEARGKISLSGNSKTKFFKFFFGKNSFLNRNYLISIHKTKIFTYSGVLGLFFIIFF